MKIGILTYFVGENYGALIQAYALQSALQSLGYDVEIINFYRKTVPVWSPSFYIGRGVAETWKKSCNAFRIIAARRKFSGMRKNFCIGKKYYPSFFALREDPPAYDIYVCGSDQIWNCTGGLKDTAYFLNFGSDKVKRVAYAPSFGDKKIPENCKLTVQKCLRRFNAVSVREASGRNILRNLGFNDVAWLPDPTLLLSPDSYDSLCECAVVPKKKIFSCILHDKQEISLRVLDWASINFGGDILNIALHGNRVFKGENKILKVSEWLVALKQSELVITNSFHAVIFALLFHRPFIAIPVQGCFEPMNERIVSLLGRVGLLKRILWEFEPDKLLCLSNQLIEWSSVDSAIANWRSEGLLFIKQALS